MQSAKYKDPALAVYAAYAYHALGQTERIREMHRYVRQEFGFGLYDLALLSGELLRELLDYSVVPSAPMLSQGWAFIDALGGSTASDELRELRSRRLPSLWTHYDATGMQLLKKWLA
jgi:hypothetical protein